MALLGNRPPRRVIHPVHAVLLGGMFALFLGTLLTDWAYSASYEVQWTNFSSWLIVGALLFTGLALLWAAIDALRSDRIRRRHRWLHVGLLLATLVVGFVNSLVHAKDAWAVMPEGMILSVVALILAVAAIWSGFAARGAGEEA